MKVNKIIHRNRWHWGESHTIVLADGAALCFVKLEDGTKAATLEDVIVSPSERGKGLGNMLVAEAIREAKRMGAKSLWLWTYTDTWMLDWYKRLGFKEDTILDNNLQEMSIEL